MQPKLGGVPNGDDVPEHVVPEYMLSVPAEAFVQERDRELEPETLQPK